MKYCKKCLFPETKPDLYFDVEGVCDSCRSAERKHGIVDSVDWKKKSEEFNALIDRATKNKKGCYDCVVPVSGGKDSTYQVLNIGVDHVHFTLSPVVVKKLVRKGLELVGDPYWVNHVGMFTIPYHFALAFHIPLVLYGENPQFEYGGPEGSRDSFVMDRRWRQEFGGMRGLREEDMIDPNLSADDLCILNYPSSELLSNANVMGVFYGSFFKWDVGFHLPLVESLGWKRLSRPPEGSWVDYENCDMKYIDIRERIKYLKFGYGRATDQLNIELRNGRISRADALAIAMTLDGNVSRENEDEFCEYLEIGREAYLEIINSFVNKNIFRTVTMGEYRLRVDRC